MTDQNDFFNQAKAQMEQWQKEIQKIQKEAMATGQAQAKAQLDAMNAQRKEAEKQLEKISTASAAAWKDMQSGFDKTWQDMEKAMETARKRFE